MAFGTIKDAFKGAVFGDAGMVREGNIHDPTKNRRQKTTWADGSVTEYENDGTYYGDESALAANEASAGLGYLYGGLAAGAQTPREAPQAETAQLDYDRVNAELGQERYARQQQEAQLQDLYAASLGLGGPSAAQQQLQAGLGQAAAGQLTAANTATGGVQAQRAAHRRAQTTNTLAAAQGNQDLAQLQAQEQAVARDQFAQGVSRYRDQSQRVMDLEYALGKAQADIGQETGIRNADRVLESRQADDKQADAYRDLYADALTQYLVDQGNYLDLGVEREELATQRDLDIARHNTQADAQQDAGFFGAARDLTTSLFTLGQG